MEDKLFLVVLLSNNGPDIMHPMEIYAKNKKQAFDLIAKDVPPETIGNVYTGAEYQTIVDNIIKNKRTNTGASTGTNNIDVADNIDAVDNISGKDFLNNSIKEAMRVAHEESSKEQHNVVSNTNQNNSQISNQPNQLNQENQIISQKNIKYFMDDGNQFKIEDNILYKKIWETVNLEESQNEDGQLVLPEFRIVNKDTLKSIKTSKYAVQQLIWKQMDIINKL